MRIGGLQPVSLLDYPQKVAAIIFTSGCNMRCPFCYNPNLVLPDLIKGAEFFDEKKIFDLLTRRKNYLDGVVITGGEPTLQNDLADFCQKVKKLGYLIKLDTNGLSPTVLEDLVKKQLIDYIAMDIKGPLDNLKKFCGLDVQVEKIKVSIDLIKNSGLPYEFRSTLVRGLHKKNSVLKMAKAIAGANLFYIQNFNRPGNLVGKKFKGDSFKLKEMEEFQRLAAQYVSQCLIR